MKKKNNVKCSLTAQMYEKNHFNFVVAVLLACLLAVMNLVISWLLQQLLDMVSGISGAFNLWQLLIVALAIVAAVIAIKFMESYFRPKFMAKAMMQYKDFAYERLMKKNMASFSKETTASYISALSNDAAVIEKDLLESQFQMISDAVIFSGALLMMIFYSPVLTAAALIFSLIPFVFSLITGGRLKDVQKEVSDKNQSFTAFLKDSLEGFAVIKSFKAERDMFRIFSGTVQSAESAKCVRRKIEILIEMAGAAAGVTAQFGVFFTGLFMALSGDAVTPGIVVVFVNLMNFVINPIQTMPALWASWKAAKGLTEKLEGQLKENVQTQKNALKNNFLHCLAMKKVTFGYSPDKTVLTDVSFQFEKGKSYAIVGASGSGKTTLLHLLMGADENYTGSIYYDDTDLHRISSDSMHQLISVIWQNVFVFNASIKDNITMFGDFPEEDIQRAVKLSGLEPLIEKRGENYLCGENGCNLSGGERQRIAIARSLLKKAPILLADEATASLDRETAFYVTKAILGIQDVTRIIVTHALDEELLRRYDCILALHNGKIAESGSFSSLMAQKGYFYSLYHVVSQ